MNINKNDYYPAVFMTAGFFMPVRFCMNILFDFKCKMVYNKIKCINPLFVKIIEILSE